MLPLDFILFLQIIIFLFITPGTPRIVIVSYSMNYGVQKCIWTALGDITANFIQATLVIFVVGSFFSARTIVQLFLDEMDFFTDSKDIESFLDKYGCANNLLFIPSFTGLGAPQWNPDIRASFYGITRDSSKKDFVTAAFNSLCYQTKEVLDAMSDDGLNIKEMYSEGSMANNKTFAQLLANITDTNISIPKNTEATAIGAAKVAAVGCGLVKNIEFFNTLKKERKFNANQHTDYRSDCTF